MTPEELSGFFEEYVALLKRYQRAPEQMPEGARTVVTRFLAFPSVSDGTSESEDHREQARTPPP